MIKNLIFLTTLTNLLYSPLAIGNPLDQLKEIAKELEKTGGDLVESLNDNKGNTKLPPCKGKDYSKWDNCFGSFTYEPNLDFTVPGRYVGEYRNGKMHGQGTWFPEVGGKYIGELKENQHDGQGTFIFNDGSKYVGQWKKDKMQGQGTMTWANGDKYVGQWKNDVPHGQGTLTLPDGRQLIGEFKENFADGQATMAFPDGAKYIGQWKKIKGTVKER